MDTQSPKQTLYYTQGLPASGKTTWAIKYAEICNGIDRRGTIVLVSRDDIRRMLYPDPLAESKWSEYVDEGLVTQVQDSILRDALQQGKDVVVHDTNLNNKTVKRLSKIADEYDAVFAPVSFMEVPIDECLERNRHRDNPVPDEVIYRMNERYLNSKG